jgi:hypothetical protein
MVYKAPNGRMFSSKSAYQKSLVGFFASKNSPGGSRKKRTPPPIQTKAPGKKIVKNSVYVTVHGEGPQVEETGSGNLTKSEIAWLLNHGYSVETNFGTKGKKFHRMSEYKDIQEVRPTSFLQKSADRKYGKVVKERFPAESFDKTGEIEYNRNKGEWEYKGKRIYKNDVSRIIDNKERRINALINNNDQSFELIDQDRHLFSLSTSGLTTMKEQKKISDLREKIKKYRDKPKNKPEKEKDLKERMEYYDKRVNEMTEKERKANQNHLGKFETEKFAIELIRYTKNPKKYEKEIQEIENKINKSRQKSIEKYGPMESHLSKRYDQIKNDSKEIKRIISTSSTQKVTDPTPKEQIKDLKKFQTELRAKNKVLKEQIKKQKESRLPDTALVRVNRENIKDNQRAINTMQELIEIERKKIDPNRKTKPRAKTGILKKAEQKLSPRNYFSLKRQDQNSDKFKDQVFQRHETVKVWMTNKKWITGKISGISHARKKAKILQGKRNQKTGLTGTFEQEFDFSQVYKKDYQTPKGNPYKRPDKPAKIDPSIDNYR